MRNFAPDELKEKKEQYEKAARKRSYILLVLLILIEVLYFYKFKSSIHSFWSGATVIVGGIIIVFIVTRMIPKFINTHILSGFSKELKKVVDAYAESNDAEKFYDDLLNMKSNPKTMRGEVVWYLNISTALIEQGKFDEAMQLLNKLEAAADKAEADFIKKHKQELKKQEAAKKASDNPEQ